MTETAPGSQLLGRDLDVTEVGGLPKGKLSSRDP